MNKEFGEQLETMPDEFVVAPLSKWADKGNLLAEAAKVAADQFAEAGAAKPVVFDGDDILVQEYHKTGQVAFVFIRMVNGQEMFAWYVWDLPDDMVIELRTNGEWDFPGYGHKKKAPNRKS